MNYRRQIKYAYAPRLSWSEPRGAGKVRLRLATQRSDGAVRKRIALGLGSGIAIAFIGLVSGQLSGFELDVPRWAEANGAASAERLINLPPPAAAPEALDTASLGAAPPSSFQTLGTAPTPQADVTAAEPARQPEETTSQTPAVEKPALEAWRTASVQTGDNLSTIFGRLGLPSTALHDIMTLGEATAGLKRLHPGQQLRFLMVEGELQELVHEESLTRSLHVRRTPDGFAAETVEVVPDTRVTSTTGLIENSLFEGGQQAGLSDAQVMQLAEVFGYDIDFVLDIRKGDRFSVVFEEYLKDGSKIGNGPILAAEFVNQGKTYRAYRFETSEGRAEYFAEDGSSLRQAFLRTPVNFSRISSYFNLARRHPVLNTIRAHRGVDYAAPVGTPIRATADGRVDFVGSKGGYGNTVVLEHSGSYSTLYAHMSRFARGVKPGSKIEQGQVIGYVGKTGLASGPHLHYEFRVNGVHKDPIRVALPNSAPVPGKDMVRFRAETETHRVQLAGLSQNTTVAAVSPATPAPGGNAQNGPGTLR